MLDQIQEYSRKYWRKIVAVIAFFAFGFFVDIFLLVIAFVGTISINATLQISIPVLTVEGFLFGLSSLIEPKARVLRTTLGIIAIMSTLMSIAVSNYTVGIQAKFPQESFSITTPVVLGFSTYQYYAISVVLFVFMLVGYWGSVAFPESKKEAKGSTNSFHSPVFEAVHSSRLRFHHKVDLSSWKVVSKCDRENSIDQFELEFFVESESEQEANGKEHDEDRNCPSNYFSW